MDPKQQFADTVGVNPGNQDSPEQFFAKIQEAAHATEVPGAVSRELTIEEERKMQDGFAIEEMTRSAGWAIVRDILDRAANHTWVDPRGMPKEEWEFAELNAFHASNNAKELLEGLSQLVTEAHELQKIKLGETKGSQRMRF